ncbi:MAG: hypothetical protein KDA45_12690 [Planctomycetales bacterium]|nr:hypothetical protein [Planctomycetales bacterium]
MESPHHPPASADLPELLQAHWQSEQVLALFADLSAAAEVEHVQIRSRGPQGIDDCQGTLAEAQSHFQAGTAQAIQIRYRYAGETWCDTLMPQADGVKIIRCHPPEQPAG